MSAVAVKATPRPSSAASRIAAEWLRDAPATPEPENRRAAVTPPGAGVEGSEELGGSLAGPDAELGCQPLAAAAISDSNLSRNASRVVSPRSTALAFPPATTVTSSMPITFRMSRR